MNCEYCQSPAHIWFQCPKKPDGWKPARLAKSTSTEDNVAKPHLHNKQALGAGAKSTAARKDVHHSNHGGAPGCEIGPQQGGGQKPSKPTVAGTQALPVDTNSSAETPSVATTSAGTVGNKDRQPKFDKKAWMKAYMKTYIRQYREDIKAGKRVPKKRG